MREPSNFTRRFCTVIALLLLSAHKFTSSEPVPECYVHTEHGKYTHYHVEMQQPPSEDCECESWNNATDFVLANCKGMDHRWVLNNTITSLFTSECFETMIFELNCKKQPIKVYCTANCTRTERLAFENNSNKADRSHLFALLVSCVCLVFAVVTVSVCLCNRRNGKRMPENPSQL